MLLIKRLIEEKGIKQRFIAGKVGVTEGHLSQVLNGKQKPSDPLALAIAHVAGIEVMSSDLFSEEDKNNE
jgi:transcriptional regulator with XRE-family HTH domain